MYPFSQNKNKHTKIRFSTIKHAPLVKNQFAFLNQRPEIKIQHTIRNANISFHNTITSIQIYMN